MYESLFQPQVATLYRVEYLCSYRPLWYPYCGEGGKIAEFVHFGAASEVANRLCDARGGQPVRVVDDDGNVLATAAWRQRIAVTGVTP